MSEPQSPDAANVGRAAKLDTASLSDAMDRLGINGQCYPLPRATTASGWPGALSPYRLDIMASMLKPAITQPARWARS